MALTPPGHRNLPDALSNLGSELMQRFLIAGERSDLDAGIDAKQQALALTAPGDPGRARRLSNLGTSLRARFESIGNGADLDAAVESGRQAVAICPADTAWRRAAAPSANTLIAVTFRSPPASPARPNRTRSLTPRVPENMRT